MPTENRSRNTEMVSVPCEHELKIRQTPLADLFSGLKTGEIRDCSDREFAVGDTVLLREIDDARDYTGTVLRRTITHVQKHYGLPGHLCVLSYGQPAPQPHPEPIAWMVGTAFWWTKEEAERDAAATGLPVVPVGPMTGSGDIGLAREMLRRALRREDKWASLCSGRNKQVAELRSKLANLPEKLISAIEREQERCSQEDYLMDSDDCIKVIREALVASGVPVPQDQPYQGIPGTSFQRLNALANQGE